MAVTLFPDGLVIDDNKALRLSTFSEAVYLPLYMDAHNDEPPPGWPAPAAKRELAEWTIKQVVGRKLRTWEHRQAILNLDEPDPWEVAK